MTFLPIVARELRVASRRRSTYYSRLGAAFVPIAIAGFWLPVFAAQFSVSQGKALFSVLSTLAFAYCLLAGARATSDCLSGEKREGTIGLLFLTDLRGYDVVLGKLVSGSLNSFYGLMAIVPVLSLALLLGGVTLEEVGRTGLLFVNTLFFPWPPAYSSPPSRHDRRAMFAAVCVILLAAAAPYALAAGYAGLQWHRFGTGPQSMFELGDFLLVSPVFAFQVLRANYISTGMMESFYYSILSTHLLGWILLAAASLVIPHTCRERPPGRLGMRWLHFRNRWSYGKPARRKAFRAKLLDQNAFYWLAARDRIKAYYVWFFIAALGLIWGWSGWMIESFIFDWDLSFWILFFFFVFLKVWLASEVCARLVEDRASGAFELLLSSPLSLSDVARGQTLALRRQFGRPVLVVIVLGYLLMRSALRGSHSGLAASEVQLLFWSLIIMLVADLAALQWVGMWQAITTNQTNRATLNTCSRILLLPTVVFFVGYAAILLAVRVTSGPVEFGLWGLGCTVWLAIGLLNDLYFGLRARWRFLHEFRDVATGRFAGRADAGMPPFREMLRSLAKRFFPQPHARPATGGLRRRPWKRWVIITPTVLALCGYLLIVRQKHSLQRQVEARLATIRAGEPVTLAELRSWSPPIPEPENAAALLQKAAGMLIPSSTLVRSYPVFKKLDWPGRAVRLSPDQQTAVSVWIEQNEEALKLLHASIPLTNSSFSITWRYFPPHQAYWQALGQLFPASQLLRFEGLLRSDAGDVPGAIESIRTLLAVAHAVGQEPALAGLTYGGAFNRAALAVLERVLNQHTLSPEVLTELDERLRVAELQMGPATARGFIGQRCDEVDEFYSPAAPAAMGMPTPTGTEKLVLDFESFAADRLGVPEKALLDTLDIFESLLERARLIGTRDLQALARVRTPRRTVEGSAHGTRLDAWELRCQDYLVEQVELLARLRTARAGLAVEQFRAAHGGLSPVSPWPVDPFNGAPLRYRRTDKGYLIYSVGRDLRDDGGKEENPNRTFSKAGFDITFTVERQESRSEMP